VVDLIFAKYPKIKQSYDVVNKLRAIFRSKTLTKDNRPRKIAGEPFSRRFSQSAHN
jgi:hypothetical protein